MIVDLNLSLSCFSITFDADIYLISLKNPRNQLEVSPNRSKTFFSRLNPINKSCRTLPSSARRSRRNEVACSSYIYNPTSSPQSLSSVFSSLFSSSSSSPAFEKLPIAPKSREEIREIALKTKKRPVRKNGEDADTVI